MKKIMTVIPRMVVLAIASAAASEGQQFVMTRPTIDGGGVIESTGGIYEVSATIGQPDAGAFLVGGDGKYEMSGGFWFGLPPGDSNDDGLVALSDYDEFGDCLTGPGDGEPLAESCAAYDMDGDGVVDLSDIAEFQAGFTGE